MGNENTPAVSQPKIAQSNCLSCSYIGKRKVKLCENCKQSVLHRYELCDHLTDYETVQKLRRCEKCQAEVDENFDGFWKPLVCDEEGNLDPEKVKSELSDFHFVIGEVVQVYAAITRGRLSKPNYHAHVVIGQVEQLKDEAICDAATEAVTNEKEEILAYIESFKNQLDPESLGYLQLETLHLHIDRNLYKPEFIPKNTPDEPEPDFNFCKNCRRTTGITKNFKCSTCGENVCVKCGCTDSNPCDGGCQRTSPGHCSQCYPAGGETKNAE